MRFLIQLIFLALFGGCSAPGGHYKNIAPATVSVDGSTFDVYVVDAAVRVIRVNFEILPSMADIGAKSIAAVELATGCSVIQGSVRGDQAVLDMRITC